MKTLLYRAFSADGVLLYIGVTTNPKQRLVNHKSLSQSWIFDVKRWQVRWYSDELAARKAEKSAIFAEHPRWNIQHRSPLHPEGFYPPGSTMQPSRQQIARAEAMRHKVA